MTTNEFGDTVLEREFETTDVDGNKSIIKLRIGIPYFKADSASSLKWRCAYQITGKGSETIRLALGMDAIDAMLMSVQLAHIWMKGYQKDTQITWMREDWLGLDFPLTSERNEAGTSAVVDEAHRDELYHQMFPNEDDKSPFKQVFDEFFRNFKPKSSSEET